jgi:hypothetical protein
MQLAFDEIGLSAVAAAYVEDDGTTVWTKNFTVAKPGVGVYVLTLPFNEGIVAAESLVLATLVGIQAVGCCIKVEFIDDRNRRVRILDDAGAPIDSDFNIVLFRTIGGGIPTPGPSL